MKTFFSSFRLSVLAAGSLLTVAVFSACNKQDNEDLPDEPVAGLMAFNLAPDVSQAGIALSGSTFNPGLTFNSYTGGYMAIYPGERPVQSFSVSGSSLATSSYTFEADKYYSLFVVGANNTYRNLVVNDNLDDLSGSGQAFVRYINAIPDSSHPTVTVTANGSSVINASAGFATVSDFVAVSPGSVSISVSNGGTIDANRTVTLEQGKIYTVLLAGVPGSTSTGVEIRYIQNGTVSEDAGRSSGSSSGRLAN